MAESSTYEASVYLGLNGFLKLKGQVAPQVGQRKKKGADRKNLAERVERNECRKIVRRPVLY